METHWRCLWPRIIGWGRYANIQREWILTYSAQPLKYSSTNVCIVPCASGTVATAVEFIMFAPDIGVFKTTASKQHHQGHAAFIDCATKLTKTEYITHEQSQTSLGPRVFTAVTTNTAIVPTPSISSRAPSLAAMINVWFTNDASDRLTGSPMGAMNDPVYRAAQFHWKSLVNRAGALL